MKDAAVELMWRFSRAWKFLIDNALWALTIPAAFLLRLEEGVFDALGVVALYAIVALPLHAAIGAILGFHRQSWGRVGVRDFVRLASGVLVAGALLFGAAWALQQYRPVPRAVPLISAALALLLLGGVRLTVRVLRERLAATRAPGTGARRVLVLGAGEAGALLCREMLRHPEAGLVPVAFLDDDPRKQKINYQGVPVLGKLADLRRVFHATAAAEALFAIPSATREVRREVMERAKAANVPLRMVPGIYDFLGSDSPARIREVLGSFVARGQPRNVLVIGGAGYIGSALVPLLLERGYNVRVLDALIYGIEPIREYLDHPRFELIQGDFRQIHNVVEAIQGIDTVIHLGALVGDPACALDEELTIEINLMATKMIAEVAKGAGVGRFVFASTCSVYGASDQLLTETSGLNPLSLYARTKIASEKVLLGMRDPQFAPTILRFGTVYGFSGRTRFDLVVNLLTAKAHEERLITIFGGNQWRPFVHVCDVAKAVRMTLEAPLSDVGGCIFNVGSDEQNYTLEGAAKVIQEIIPNARIVDSGSDSDQRNYRVSFERIRQVVGFTPDWSLRDGVQQVERALREGRIKDYREPMYSNVRFLSDEGLSKLVRREFGRALEALDASPAGPAGSRAAAPEPRRR